MIFRSYLCIVFTMLSLPAYAQEIIERPKDDQGIFNIVWENDIFGGTDQNYTNGIRFAWLITDRDIVIRAVCKSIDVVSEKVVDYMTTELYFCREENTLEEAAEEMRKHNISRLLVKNEAGLPTGIISFGLILRNNQSLGEFTKVVQCAVGGKAA